MIANACTQGNTPAELILSRLQGVRANGPGRWMARCPAHSDRTASLSVRETDDGRVLLNCFGGCSVDEITAAVGLDLASLYPRECRSDRHRAAHSSVPTIHWRDFVSALRDVLTALLLAADDIAEGIELSEADLSFIKDRASRVRDLIELVEGGSHA